MKRACTGRFWTKEVWERKEERAGWDSPREAIEEVENRRLFGSALGIGGRGQAQEVRRGPERVRGRDKEWRDGRTCSVAGWA